MKLTMDVYDNAPPPKRGDRLRSATRTYYVLHAREVKRRVETTIPRYSLFVANMEELEDATRGLLVKSAIRRGGSILYHFRFYSRKKTRALSFEQLMRGERR